MNLHGDCLDSDRAILPDYCCETYQECAKQIQGLQTSYDDRLYHDYMEGCGVLEEDVAPDDQGRLEVVDSTRICSETCLAAEETWAALPEVDLAELEGRCGRAACKVL